MFLSNRRFVPAVAVLIALIAWCVPGKAMAVQPDGGVSVAVAGETWVTGDKVYLGDIAEIKGPDAIRDRLAAIELAYAPSPGCRKTFHRTWVMAKIRSERGLPGDAHLEIPSSIVVARNSQTIDDEYFAKLYRGYLETHGDAESSDLQLRRFRVTGNGPVPEGEVAVDLIRQDTGALVKNVSLDAVVSVDGKAAKRLVLSGWVDRFEDVVTAARPLQRNSIISEEDLALERRNVSRLPDNVVKTFGAVAGKRIKVTVKAGDAIVSNVLETPPLIARGDRVKVVIRASNLIVTTTGIAQDKGAAGAQIRVRNLSSKKDIIASVVDASTVVVEF